jgi:hypothetical protein
MGARRLACFWGINMEDLLEKFYGKSASKGLAGAPVPDESAPQPEPEPKPQHDPRLEQRVSHIESQLQKMAETQQTILSRLDTESQQEPTLVWQTAWHALRTAWKGLQPELGKLWSDDGTPLRWDSVHRTLHVLDDASEDMPPVKNHSDRKIKCTCTICGRRVGLRSVRMARADLRSAETIHCPGCYAKNRQARQLAYVMAVVVGLVVLIIIASS